MRPITLYTSNCRGNKFNVCYPVKREITSVEDLREAVRYDQVFAEYRDHHRAVADFIRSDCLPFDCDNDHTPVPPRTFTQRSTPPVSRESTRKRDA